MNQLKNNSSLKKYETPRMEADYFETQDVILTSGENPDIGENPDEPIL